MKQLSYKLDKSILDTRDMVKKHLLPLEHAYKDEKGHWRIKDIGYDFLLAHIEPDPSHPPPEAAIPIGLTQVPVHALPINARLVLVEVEGQIYRATVKPAIRQRLKKGNLVFVEHMEGDMYHVVRV